MTSNFAATDHLDLLRDTASPLFLPIEVYDEIVAGQMAGYQFYDDIEMKRLASRYDWASSFSFPDIRP